MNNKHHFKDIRLALIFKDFAVWTNASCVGLNVAGFTTAKYLNHHGIDTIVFPVRHNIDVVNAIDHYNETHDKRLTHVVISAPWLSVYDLKSLITNFSDIQFVILSHSNIGFLQADPNGMELLRKYSEISSQYSNIVVGGNSYRFTEWFKKAYNKNCVYLPNLYPIKKIKSKIWSKEPPLKIGAFGAIRPEKNFMTAAAAALVMHSQLNIPTELHMITSGEHTKSTTLKAIIEMTENIDGFSLIQHKWETWDKFIKLIEDMDLLLQISYSESFNMITADGISVGVPSVISSAIRWAPDSWKTDIDDAVSAANKGIELLTKNQYSIGYDALQLHNNVSFPWWEKFLNQS